MHRVRGKVKGLTTVLAFPDSFVIIKLKGETISFSPTQGVYFSGAKAKSAMNHIKQVRRRMTK